MRLGMGIDLFIREELPEAGNDTWRRTRQQLEFWASALGDIPIAELHPRDIKRVADELKRTPLPSGKIRKGGTVNRYLAALSAFYSWAEKDQFIVEENPVRRVRRYKESGGRTRLLTREEYARLLEACRKSMRCDLEMIVQTASVTGFRVGEMAQLRWEAIEWGIELQLPDGSRGEFARLYVPESKNGEPINKLVPARFLPLLKERRRYSGLVIERDWKKSFKTACVRAEIPDICRHTLRHYCASCLAMSGATSREITQYLGQKSIQMALRYQHLSPTHGAAVANKAAGFF